MHVIHLITWAAAGVFAGPLAGHNSSPRNEAVGARNERRAESGPSSIAIPTPSSELPSQPSSLAVPTTSDFIIVTPTPSPTSAKPLDGDCTSTLYLNLFTYPFNPPTRTVHLTTVTSTYGLDCDGCRYLATINIGGLGPVLQGGKTTTDATPATVTEFACSV